MFDYDVHYKGCIITNLRGDTDQKALNLAKKIYGPFVTVSRA